MKNAYLLIGIVVVLVAVGGGYLLWMQQEKAAVETNQTPTQPTGEPAVTIVRTNDGYEPKEVTIKKGDIVLFTNESDMFHWPASDLHPTHGVYPEFDPLDTIAPGEEWKFQFDKVGVWKYHDHIRANKVGTITVTE